VPKPLHKTIQRRATRDAKIIQVKHHEIDERVDQSAITDLERTVANMLFRLWLKQRSIKEDNDKAA
jgi:hypothetical protein